MANIKEKNIYVFCNQKGGVGKTTTVVNVATTLANLGFKVLLVDLDPQGNATSGFGMDKNTLDKTVYHLFHDVPINEIVIKEAVTNLDVLGSNADLAAAEIELIDRDRREFFLKEKLGEIRGEYDFILLDCPPSLGLLTINALVAANRLIIPLQCEYYALEGLGQLIDTHSLVADRLNPELDLYGVVLTMADFRTNLTEQVISEVREFFKEKVFEVVIPRSIKLSEAPGFGQPAVIYAPNAKGSYHYQLLAEELLDRLGVNYSYSTDSKSKAAAKMESGDEVNRKAELTEHSNAEQL